MNQNWALDHLFYIFSKYGDHQVSLSTNQSMDWRPKDHLRRLKYIKGFLYAQPEIILLSGSKQGTGRAAYPTSCVSPRMSLSLRRKDRDTKAYERRTMR